MFTGIIEGTGKVLKIGPGRLVVTTPFMLTRDGIGSSIAVNGCCLTIARKRLRQFTADLSPETLRVTNLGTLRPGGVVNLERPLRLGDRLGGHLVQGHVDGVGRVLAIRHVGANLCVRTKKGQTHGSAPTILHEITVQFPKHLRPYLIPKGSIAVDGISMTINQLTAKHFSLVVVPHTLKVTNFSGLKKGQLVNLEADMVGKYMVAQISPPFVRRGEGR